MSQVLFAIIDGAGPGSVNNQTYCLRSDDLGTTWTTVARVGTLTVNTSGSEKCFHGANLGSLYICFGFSGVWKSINQGVTWAQILIPETEFYNAVWARSLNDVWVNGHRNVAGIRVPFVQRWNGLVWSTLTDLPIPSAITGQSVIVDGIFALDANNVWCLGHRVSPAYGIIWYFNGVNWSIVHERSTSNFHCVWAFSPTDVWVSGNFDLTLVTNVVLHLESGSWVNHPPALGLNHDFWAITGSSSNDVWTFPQNHDAARHWDGIGWTVYATGQPPIRECRHCWYVDGTHVYAGYQISSIRANMMQWTGSWVDLTSEFSTNADYTHPAVTRGIFGIIPPSPTRNVTVKDIFVVAEDVLEVNFHEDIIIEDHYLDPTNYSITDISTGATVYIDQILDPKTIASDKVYLVVRGLQLGLNYKLKITDAMLYDRDGLRLIFEDIPWLMRRTKVDSTLNSLAGLYNTQNRSNIRGLLEAIMISDEKIGGDY